LKGEQGALTEQNLSDGFLLGQIKGGFLVLIDRIDVSPGLQQAVNNIAISTRHGCMQWCPAISIHSYFYFLFLREIFIIIFFRFVPKIPDLGGWGGYH